MIPKDRSPGTTPVSPEAPCGRDVRYEEVFTALQQEMEKRLSPSTRDRFSWDTVAAMSVHILKEHSKDLLAASYLAVALAHLNGAAGLEQGTGILAGLLTTYWDGLFPPPKRVKGRIAALSWWMENTRAAMALETLRNPDKETGQKIRLNLEAIDTFLKSRPELLDSLPPIEPMIRDIERLPDSATGSQEKAPQAIERSPMDEGPVCRFDEELPGAREVHKSLGPFFQRIRQAAKILHDDRPDNPQAYRWLRFAIWDPLTGVPVSKNTVTRIPPPQPQLLHHLETLERDEDWAGLVRASESALHSSRNLFFLDLNRFSRTALARMGPSFNSACQAVTEETRFFVSRLKGLETLHFSDESPFASEKTLDWLKGPDHPDQDTASGFSMAWTPGKDIEQAVARWKSHGDLREAAAFFQDRINRSGSEKDTLFFRLELFNILAASKQAHPAAAQAEAMIESMTLHNLEHWDPGLAMALLKAIHRGFRPCPELKNRINPDNILVRMGRLDAVQALKL